MWVAGRLGSDAGWWFSAVARELGLPIRSMTWSWLLEVCVSSDDERRALDVLKAMEAREISPSETSLSAIQRQIQFLGGFYVFKSKLQPYL